MPPWFKALRAVLKQHLTRRQWRYTRRLFQRIYKIYKQVYHDA